MGPIDSERKIRNAGEEDDCFASAFQLRLAASVVDTLIERTGGCGAADGFWDHNSFETELDQDEYLDPELWDPDEDPVPDMAAEINENIFECL
jgi:hypothetical protein